MAQTITKLLLQAHLLIFLFRVGYAAAASISGYDQLSGVGCADGNELSAYWEDQDRLLNFRVEFPLIRRASFANTDRSLVTRKEVRVVGGTHGNEEVSHPYSLSPTTNDKDQECCELLSSRSYSAYPNAVVELKGRNICRYRIYICSQFRYCLVAATVQRKNVTHGSFVAWVVTKKITTEFYSSHASEPSFFWSLVEHYNSSTREEQQRHPGSRHDSQTETTPPGCGGRPTLFRVGTAERQIGEGSTTLRPKGELLVAVTEDGEEFAYEVDLKQAKLSYIYSWGFGLSVAVGVVFFWCVVFGPVAIAAWILLAVILTLFGMCFRCPPKRPVVCAFRAVGSVFMAVVFLGVYLEYKPCSLAVCMEGNCTPDLRGHFAFLPWTTQLLTSLPFPLLSNDTAQELLVNAILGLDTGR